MLILQNGFIRSYRYAVTKDADGRPHHVYYTNNHAQAQEMVLLKKEETKAAAIRDLNNTPHEKFVIRINGKLALEGFGILDPERNEDFPGVQLEYNKDLTYSVPIASKSGTIDLTFVGSWISRCLIKQVKLGNKTLFQGEKWIWNSSPDGNTASFEFANAKETDTLTAVIYILFEEPDIQLPEFWVTDFGEEKNSWADGIPAENEEEMYRILEAGPPSLEEIKEKKRAEIKQACHDKIVAGFDFAGKGPERGLLHYTLEQHKQDDMKVLMEQIKAGKTQVPWRDASRSMHEIYSAEEFTALFEYGMAFVVRCKLRSDGLEELISRLETPEEVAAVTWDTELPEDIQANIDQLAEVIL